MDAHIRTLHGGVGLVMTDVRKDYWIPRLRSLTKRIIKRCYGSKRHQASAFAKPPPGNLPRNRTEGSWPFQVVGIDYAGPERIYSDNGKTFFAAAKWLRKATQKVLLDVETIFNSRPLSYVEDDLQMPTLTPHAMIVGRPNLIPESTLPDEVSADLTKRAKYLQRCKDAW